MRVAIPQGPWKRALSFRCNGRSPASLVRLNGGSGCCLEVIFSLISAARSHRPGSLNAFAEAYSSSSLQLRCIQMIRLYSGTVQQKIPGFSDSGMDSTVFGNGGQDPPASVLSGDSSLCSE